MCRKYLSPVKNNVRCNAKCNNLFVTLPVELNTSDYGSKLDWTIHLGNK